MSVVIYRKYLQAAKEEAARRLQRAATFYWTEHTSRQSVQNSRETRTRTRNTSRGPKGSTYSVYPNVSRPGEYLRKATGFGIANTIWGPTDVATIIADGFKVRIGVFKNAAYMQFWEFRKRSEIRRLGFQRTLEDLRVRLSAILGSAP